MEHYPMLCGWASVRVTGPNRAEVVNERTGERFEVEDRRRIVSYILRLDGRSDPYTISPWLSREEVMSVLNRLNECHLLREERFLYRGLGFFAYPLYVSRGRRIGVKAPKNLNTALLISFLPILAAGILFFISHLPDTVDVSVVGLIFGILLGVALHEGAHAAAALSYGGKVYEIGISLSFFIVPGAYVLSECGEKAGVLQDIQHNAAGIEMNGFLSGLFFFMGGLFPGLAGFCLTAALANAGLMLLNLSFHGDLDGYHIMNVLLGEAEDIVEVARDSVTLKDMRAELRRQGMTGKVKLGAYYLVIVLQYALPFSLILDIGGLFLWLR